MSGTFAYAEVQTIDYSPEEKARGILAVDNIPDELANVSDRKALVGFGSFSVAKRSARAAYVLENLSGITKGSGGQAKLGVIKIKNLSDTPNGSTVVNIMKGRLPRSAELPTIELELPMTKGTVKFFNETKKLGGGKIIDVIIKINGQDV